MREDVIGRANVEDTPELDPYYAELGRQESYALWTVANSIEPPSSRSPRHRHARSYAVLRPLQPDPGFVPLGPATPAFFSMLGTLWAVLLLAVIGRYSRRPLWLFQRIVLIALPITWLPDILLLFVGAFPGTNLATVLVLMLMHVVAVLGLLTLLPSLLRE